MPLKNFGVVYARRPSEGGYLLTRSAQPDQDSFGSLWLLGIKQVFKLNLDEEFRDAVEKDWWEEQYSLVSGDSIRVRLCPLPEIFRAEYTDSVIMTVCAMLDAMKTGSIHVHCVHGTDRTGLVCAAFMLMQGTSMDAVMKYRKTFGVTDFRDLIDYQDHPVLKEIDRRVKAGQLPPKGVDRV
jgi:protein-tyrosine phosphatase family protein